jgi:hypothetical protein
MCSYDNSKNNFAVNQINSDLQHAQVELLSAHCATYQLRLHYSANDLARFGRRDVLRKSAEAASALNEFYSAIESQLPQTAPPAEAPSPQLSPDQVAGAIGTVSTYLREQREHYFPAAIPLSSLHKARMWPYFSHAMLSRVRIVELHGQRVSAPSFYSQARDLRFDNLPEVSHMNSLTFLDVIVFHGTITERSLFHALVHAVQFHVLGLDRYTELFVKSFLKTKAHFTVPLEAHAFSLESKFMRPLPERFSVEDHVLRWVADGRY